MKTSPYQSRMFSRTIEYDEEEPVASDSVDHDDSLLSSPQFQPLKKDSSPEFPLDFSFSPRGVSDDDEVWNDFELALDQHPSPLNLNSNSNPINVNQDLLVNTVSKLEEKTQSFDNNCQLQSPTKEDWKKAFTSDGRPYFYHIETRESRWKLSENEEDRVVSPSGEHTEKKEQDTKESNHVWEKAFTDDGRVYYFNRGTNKTSWKNPSESFSLALHSKQKVPIRAEDKSTPTVLSMSTATSSKDFGMKTLKSSIYANLKLDVNVDENRPGNAQHVPVDEIDRSHFSLLPTSTPVPTMVVTPKRPTLYCMFCGYRVVDMDHMLQHTESCALFLEKTCPSPELVLRDLSAMVHTLRTISNPILQPKGEHEQCQSPKLPHQSLSAFRPNEYSVSSSYSNSVHSKSFSQLNSMWSQPNVSDEQNISVLRNENQPEEQGNETPPSEKSSSSEKLPPSAVFSISHLRKSKTTIPSSTKKNPEMEQCQHCSRQFLKVRLVIMYLRSHKHGVIFYMS